MSPRSVRMQSSVRVAFSPMRELFKVPVVCCRSLPASTIDLWPLTLAGEDAEYDRCLDWLDRQERERAARFLRRQDRERYVLAHGGLRFILGLYLGLAPARIEFGSTSTGKPTIAGLRPEDAALTFNLSHAHGNAIVAVGQGREVGVDLEMIREDVEVLKLAERFFSDREQLHVRSTAPESRSKEFFHYWVAKEAVLKAEGVGLASLQACEIDWSSGSDRDGVPVRLAGRSQLPWVVRTLDCGPGWVGAVAAQGSDWTINPCATATD
ncbi:MAG: 4'-phosphopantetheinyl transferase superfamily protein [Nitrospira sp.]|nr:4'-phosphopantetheinyl transferase superfamily protein [Nitrospira sp.]